MSSRFGVIGKKVKTWTHLPEKLPSKNKGTRSACVRCPNYVDCTNVYLNYLAQMA